MATERNIVTQAGFQAHNIAPGTSFTLISDAIGSTGAIGDRLQRLIVNILIPSSAKLSVLDGTMEYQLIIPSVSLVPGMYQIEFGCYSSLGPWSVVTGSGIRAVAIGLFS